MSQGHVWTGPAPENITAWTIVQAGHAIGRRFWNMLSAIGLSPIQFGVLLQLDLHPSMSNGQIARAVLVTPQTMSELMTSLEKNGLVERDSPAGRGRRVTARLTAAGQDRLRKCIQVITDIENTLDLTPKQSTQLNEQLHHLIATEDNP